MKHNPELRFPVIKNEFEKRGYIYASQMRITKNKIKTQGFIIGIKRVGIVEAPCSSPMIMDKVKALVAVKRCGLALQRASQELQDDKEVALAAVKQNGTALEYASLELRNDVEIVKVAIDNWPGSVYFASERVKKQLKDRSPTLVTSHR